MYGGIGESMAAKEVDDVEMRLPLEDLCIEDGKGEGRIGLLVVWDIPAVPIDEVDEVIPLAVDVIQPNRFLVVSFCNRLFVDWVRNDDTDERLMPLEGGGGGLTSTAKSFSSDVLS